jgi:hypothetical protein
MSSKTFFKKAACFTDLHYGLKNNSRQHNNDCEEFIKWFIEKAKEEGCETCIFLGDFHHHRASVNVSTLNYMVSGLKMLSEGFENVYFITGNHDLFYREKREIHSVPMGELFDNIHMIDEVMVEGDVAIVPWLVGDEHKEIVKLKTKYMFGHFEIPGFKLNAMIEMPDHGGLKRNMFKHQDYVFSGHFHKRQWGDNVHYIGNPFGHNYSDVWDFDRGCMILEWGSEPQYINWEDGPKYVNVLLSDLAEHPDDYLLENANVKVVIDLQLSYEEVNYMKELFSSQYNIRELKMVPQKNEDLTNASETDIAFETVDQIVVDQITAMESEKYSTQTLLTIYRNLD